MARKTIKLPSLSRVTAGAKATLEVPVGPTYYGITFSATGTSLAVEHIGRIDVYLDGKVVQTYKDLQRLIDLNGYYNRSTDTVNEFMLHFFRAELMDVVYRRATGFGTQDVSTFHIEMQLDAAAPADIAITAHARANPASEPLGAFFKVREYPFSSAVAGEVEIDKLPRQAFYGAVHLFKPDVNSVQVEVGTNEGQVRIIDATKAVLEREQKEASPKARVPVTAKATHIDMMLEGDVAQSIDTRDLKDFRLKLDLGTAGAVDIITETLGTIQAG